MTGCKGIVLTLLTVLVWLHEADSVCFGGKERTYLRDWTGNIHSPNYGKESYPAGQRCVWHISLSKGSRIRVIFGDFNLDPKFKDGENANAKCQDFVKIVEGVNDTGQGLGTHCGGTAPAPLISRTNEITVIFVSDSNGGSKGFNLTYSGTCENINVTETGTIVESPNYPGLPPENVRCEWWVSVPPRLFPLVRVPDFRTNATKCDDAIINLYGPNDETSWICSDRKDPVKFNGNKMVVEYTKRDINIPAAVFTLNITFVDKCTDNRCHNGGTCEEEMFGVVCFCMPSFTGDRCQIKLVTCAESPCQNRANCTDTPNGVTCQCPSGYTGESCEDTVSYCSPNPCMNLGTCQNVERDFKCQCRSGFTGKMCESLVKECERNPCENGGTCDEFRNGFTCSCVDGFTGERCQIELESCNDDMCRNGGICQRTPDGALCACQLGFTGENCETDMDDCQANPCRQGSTCSDVDNGYKCLCLPGFTGPRCYNDIDECETKPCRNNGTCENRIPGFRCECPTGYGGPVCENDINQCDPNPCRGKSECVDKEGEFECICPSGYTGRTCDTEVDPCTSSPCQNGAPCVSTTTTSGSAYVCECTLGYDGEECQIEINECASRPCKNGGSCRDKVNAFECDCPRGFIGAVCENTITQCETMPCKNGGTCDDLDTGFECLCNAGYTGSTCEKDINECEENVCKNNGTCVDRIGLFECNCLPGFTGKTCEIDIDECDLNTCEHAGICVDFVNDFRCRCNERFDGKNCEFFLFKDSPHCEDDLDENEISWFSTRVDTEEVRPCPPGIMGDATRFCVQKSQAITGGVWSDPDLRNCISPKVVQISKEAQRLLSQKSITDQQLFAVTSQLANATTYRPTATLYPGDLLAVADTMGVVAKSIAKASATTQGVRKVAEVYGDTFGNLVDPRTHNVWSKIKDVGFIEEKLARVLDATELLAENIAFRMTLSYKRRKRDLYDTVDDTTINVVKENIEFRVKVYDGRVTDEFLTYQGHGGTSSIALPPDVVSIAREHNQGTFGVYNGKYPTLSRILAPRQPTNRTCNQTRSGTLNSDVISVKIVGVPRDAFDNLLNPVVLVFQLKNRTTDLTPLCSFLNVSASSKSDRWPTKGCEVFEQNSSHVVCHCFHMTNFAVLMDVYGIADQLSSVHQKTLSFISYVGGTLSIVGCILAIAVFEYFRLKSDRVRIHEQLAISIIMVQFIFLLGIDRRESEYVCKVFAILLHYSLLAMFCWMLVEGIHLYVILVKVFKKGSHLKKYMAVGWGIPLVIVAVSVGVFYNDYGQGGMCWMTNFMLLVLFVPIATVVILLNVFVLVVVVRVMMKSFSIAGKTNSEEASSIRITLKAAAVLLPLLGLTWTFCFLSFDRQATLLFTYLFTVCNCLQGVLFFVFHCLLNIDVRKAYERRYKRPKQTSIHVANGDRNTTSVRKSSLMTTECDPFVDAGPYNGSSLSYRSSTKSDDTEFSDLSYYSKHSLNGGSQIRINNLSSTVPDNVYRTEKTKITAESNLSNISRPT